MNTNGISRPHSAPSVIGGVARCPTCDSAISKEKYDRILRITDARQKELAAQEAELRRERQKMAIERIELVKGALAKEKAKWEAEAARAARKSEQDSARLARELAALKKKTVAETDARVREAKRAAEEQQRATVEDLRKQLKTLEQRRQREEAAMKQNVADLQRKAEGRDRGHFGIEGEEDLLAALKQQFPSDRIVHRGKGGDILQSVVDAARDVGTIVFEVKNTRSWQSAYVRQTRDAAVQHGAAHGFLITRTFPKGRGGICVIDGIVVTTPDLAPHVVGIIREAMVSLARMQISEEGKTEKMEALFNYLRSPDFRAALDRVQGKIGELRESLTREKSMHDGLWSTRENCYASILRAAAGVDAQVADLIAGGSRKQ